MDPRSTLSRNSSSNMPQTAYNPNMASGYAMPSYGNNTHLPPINYHPPPQLPPTNQGYHLSGYRTDLPTPPRYNPAPSPVQTPDMRYNQTPTQQSMSTFPSNSVLPSPHAQNQQPQQQAQQQANYANQPGNRQSYPQPLAPAPPRTNMDPFGGAGYGQPGDNRQPAWSGAESIPGMSSEVGRDPTRTHVVGSQGRRGILPSAPGRPPVMTNGMNGSPKANAIPQKDADGKFPCPNCTKTYLHAKHLKRHMLRHTGDRPYMCVLCNDTFSRSDILKRHFQKCSVRRGNPTGASHLSNPAAHLKKSQAAAAKAAATASPASATTPNSSAGMATGPYTSTSMPTSSMTTTATSMAPVGTMPYAMANGQSDMQRSGQNQHMQANAEQGNMDPNGPKNWQLHNARNSQMMYHSNSTSPDHFNMGAGNDDKSNVMSGSHHVSDQWNQMPSFGGNEQYMNQMFTPYEQNQNDGKKDYAHEGGSNGYYIPPTSLGADGIAPRATK
ncbi:hypothetical protein R6Q59_010009 [Mikania micrantha]